MAQGDALWLADPQSPTRYETRNFSAEKAALSLGWPAAVSPGRTRKTFITSRGKIPVLNFFAREFSALEKEWDVTLEERLERSTHANLERIEPRFQITPSGEEWFNMNVSYGTPDGERFAAADIQRLLLSGQSHTKVEQRQIRTAGHWRSGGTSGNAP